METELFIVLLLAICLAHHAHSAFTLAPINHRFMCQRDVPPHPLKLKELAGIWYEVGRAPSADVMRCLNVTVPESATNELVLQLSYIATYGRKPRAVRESVSFAWDNQTQNSVFNLFYNVMDSEDFPSVTYKMIYTDYTHITLICGFAGFSPMPLFKILSRKKELDKEIADYIQKQVNKSRYRSKFMWTDQFNCNAADCSLPGLMSIIFLAISIWWYWWYSSGSSHGQYI